MKGADTCIDYYFVYKIFTMYLYKRYLYMYKGLNWYLILETVIPIL